MAREMYSTLHFSIETIVHFIVVDNMRIEI